MLFTTPHLLIDLLLLLIRIILAVSFIIAAYNKSRNYPKFAKSNGLPVPVAIMLSIAELCGGGAVLLGVLAQLAAAGLVLLMVSTLFLHIAKWHSPYWAAQGGWEYDLMLLALAGVIAAFGTGRFALVG